MLSFCVSLPGSGNVRFTPGDEEAEALVDQAWNWFQCNESFTLKFTDQNPVRSIHYAIASKLKEEQSFWFGT